MGKERSFGNSHGDITVFRRYVIYNSTIDGTLTFQIFKTSDHAEESLITILEGPTNDKLFVFDVQVEVFNWVMFAVWIFYKCD